MLVFRAVLTERGERQAPHTIPRDMRTDTFLEKWRTEKGTQDHLTGAVLAVLTDIFERGEEVPVVVSAIGTACRGTVKES